MHENIVRLKPGIIYEKAGVVYPKNTTLIGNGTTIVLEGSAEYGLKGESLGLVDCVVDAQKADVNRVVHIEQEAFVSRCRILGGRVACLSARNADIFISGLSVGRMKIDGPGTGYGILLENCSGSANTLRAFRDKLRHLCTVVGNKGPLFITDSLVSLRRGFAALDLHGRGDENVVGIKIVGRINVGNTTHKEGSKNAVLIRCSGPLCIGHNSTYQSILSTLKVVNETPQTDMADRPDISR